MNKFLAHLFLIVLGLTLQLVNYWYTFGLWPKSWTSFILCGLGSILLMVLVMLLKDDD